MFNELPRVTINRPACSPPCSQALLNMEIAASLLAFPITAAVTLFFNYIINVSWKRVQSIHTLCNVLIIPFWCPVPRRYNILLLETHTRVLAALLRVHCFFESCIYLMSIRKKKRPAAPDNV
ncbi:hypothetical protein E2C01_091997 [Portunus trituberculatus]|uniref:Uncharacterized protein n=1 Tax=Portunus trituberculatus TaxID=210409 RepID=A0A5B7JFF0_PORTR|nr:hypothetical protein [Portunus trituberculatus]